MGAQGTAVLDFGAFPGKSDASVAVTGQAGIIAGSLAEAWIRPVDTADHTADEHMLETLKVFAASIIAGTGFTIYGVNTSELNEPLSTKQGENSIISAGTSISNKNAPVGTGPQMSGGIGTRLYGAWTIAWAWN